MRHSIFWPICLVLVLLAGAAMAGGEEDIEEVLRFEGPHFGETPRGWGGGPPATIHVDSTVVHGGDCAVRLERDSGSPNSFTTITKSIPLDYEGQYVELRGYLRTEGVTEYAGLWMREDGPGGMVQFDNMQGQGLKGNTDWAEYSIRLFLDPRAEDLFFGVLVAGEGTVWADDLELLIDDKPFHQAPERVRVPTVIDTDHRFEGGSGVTVTELTDVQVENLALLTKVWGFLKYNHPGVAGGKYHWDFELLGALPEFLATPDRETAITDMAGALDLMGPPEACDPCAEAPEDAHLLPRLDWIRDTGYLGEEISAYLQTVHANRFVGDEHFYLSTVDGVRNPIFDHEPGYKGQQPPDAGYRILAVMRLWNIIEYWFPYRDLMDADWDDVLHEFLPRLVAADTWDAYRLELFALAAHIQDGHANLWRQIGIRPPVGECGWPVELRFLEEKFFVAAYTDSVKGPASEFEIGDIITTLDGVALEELLERWTPYYCASNRPTMLKDMARSLSRGDCGPGRVGIERQGQKMTVNVDRVEVPRMNWSPADRAGDTFQMLSDEVAYLKLSSVAIKEVPEYIEKATGTRGLVIDIRNYPSEFMVFALGQRLIDEPTPFTRFTTLDPANPGAFIWTDPLILQPEAPGYEGKVVILINETSMSQAEYTAMALRAGPRAVVVGSTTAGADGNVSNIPLPGGLNLMMSGIGVFYPDKTPTQRVGIVPDVFVTPTIEGTIDGRDEVLEAALREILGSEVDEETIRRMAARP